MTTVIYVRSYSRKKPATAVTYLDTTEALYPLGLQHLLAADLDRALEKDRLAGWPEEQANRIRESM